MKRYMKRCLAVAVTGLVVAGGMAAGDSKLTTVSEPEALTCSLSDPAFAERRAELQAKFWPAVKDVKELDDGYSLQLAGDDAQLALDFVAFERGCCNFLSFVVELEPKNGPVRLTVAGPKGTKEFLDAALGNNLRTDTKKGASKPASKKSFLDKCCEALGI